MTSINSNSNKRAYFTSVPYDRSAFEVRAIGTYQLIGEGAGQEDKRNIRELLQDEGWQIEDCELIGSYSDDLTLMAKYNIVLVLGPRQVLVRSGANYDLIIDSNFCCRLSAEELGYDDLAAAIACGVIAPVNREEN